MPKTYMALAAFALSLPLIGCERRPATPPESESKQLKAQPDPNQDGKVSIIRPEVEAEQNLPPREPLEASISFADNGSKLSDDAKLKLNDIAQSAQARAGGNITLRGHTDSSGADDVNRRVSQRRAEVVRDYLVEQGIAADRIRVIALGETRPIAPNATLEGEPDEAGQARNRRVDVVIAVPESAASETGARAPSQGPAIAE